MTAYGSLICTYYFNEDEQGISNPHAWLTILAIVFSFYQLAFNNLLINLRMSVKPKYVTLGFCCFDVINWMVCYCSLRHICIDKCFKAITIIKWVVYTAFFTYLFVGTTEASEQADVPFNVICLVFGFQYVVLALLRVTIWLFFSIFVSATKRLGYELDDDDEEEFPRIISHNYVQLVQSNHNNFEHHALFGGEVAFNQGIREVRQSLYDNRLDMVQVDQVPESAYGQIAIQDLKSTHCPICIEAFE